MRHVRDTFECDDDGGDLRGTFRSAFSSHGHFNGHFRSRLNQDMQRCDHGYLGFGYPKLDGQHFDRDGYNAYRGTEPGGPYTELNSSLIAMTTYTDLTVQVGQTYYYLVTSVDADDVESIYSDEVSATIP